ncbi:hypothetical protein CS0771_31910 [Catellatospora sp. IY07-71]|uniref:hypothetical protein n=1 Tax=Catellatospora sp. IY07-71 TaxID=2728827 RepID=UPI001BB3CF0F|nr:hypothetical protein [Catellatospora sp. IY07-71]BCJ73647.1 hypothetical protein CS0771_31910 [Catellatospora sp. IY07-71]
MSETPGPADGSFRLQVTAERIRLDNAGALIDVPLACLAEYEVAETPDPEVFDLRISFEVQVTEVMLRHRGIISVFEALGRSWEAASGRLPGPAPALAGGLAEHHPYGEPDLDSAVPAEPVRVEPEPVLRGPALVADAPEWIIFGPLADTRRLSEAELMTADSQQTPR